ncbi:uncharacterized protein NDAI_0G02880 [Naumovozyma dairenensis CBS 421]|uniref:Uncharacterized protein n=1 Tax=Naumovozyma dairenensis (strain ATCC 10597 / BCRC 20456 / CBS 421 / NBRC 0211 / NRRL Y-12639) TaxID=1071378 RepID=G0WE54_NAUDC|nr:hypothetical protein NDAI_0G02880 [Naumovozyma dairenensis CBS 421]CCD26065.2 hypothetical protein NDAI_0G02880 [Naumovozyma dairenensis CBS 421]
MGVFVMRMVYFSAFGPYRFPGLLVVLKYAGNRRNLFVHPISRCIGIITQYSKSRDGKRRYTVFDKMTSDYLFYYVVVLRLILRSQQSTDFDDMSRHHLIGSLLFFYIVQYI